MNFFQWQRDAKRKTQRLLLLMFITIILLSIGIYFLIFFVFWFAADTQLMHVQGGMPWFFSWEFYLLCLVVVAAVIAVGSMTKLHKLSAGGFTVAESLGGRLVTANTEDFYEKRLLNVVEEMAIASGCGVPDVYLLENERGINAFAAGYELDDAIIGVTKGCIHNLTRDELEGVIAHEFSHIIHGDMRLNIRLIGVVFGITMISEFGEHLLYARDDRNRSWLLGGGLLLLGFMGMLAASWIKSSICRTREYLADASALQYTRNPDGISNALKRIGGSQVGTLLNAQRASEVTHMTFGRCTSRFATETFASHPPLEDRIRKLEPKWDGTFLSPLKTMTDQPETETSPSESVLAVNDTVMLAVSKQQPTLPFKDKAQFKQTVMQVGVIKQDHLAYAKTLLKSPPMPVITAIHDPLQVHLVMMALLFDQDEDEQIKQLAIITKAYSDNTTAVAVQQMATYLVSFSSQDLLALLEIAKPVLKLMSLMQRTQLNNCLFALAKADGKLCLFEWALLAMVKHYDNKWSETYRAGSLKKSVDLAMVAEDIQIIIAAICQISQMPKPQQLTCFAAAMQQLSLQGEIPSTLSFGRLYKALQQCTQLKLDDKESLIETCSDCIAFDQSVILSEVQLMRVIAVILECPIPPVVYQHEPVKAF
ncbi:M48 family metalloprotease [Zooshikella marina]|uniref:M48 family metalloprotease n=1 Tax=Zooshikella ganghwensis TaxID=202772 RepID=UPI001BAFD3FB|nr:M48 family metalloprotease [Zooshikella ganghwensis]MBU2709098.1 M48 family metalloprotease [Zooshikella ganghwensis]